MRQAAEAEKAKKHTQNIGQVQKKVLGDKGEQIIIMRKMGGKNG